jgi:hypothetical protein
MHFLHYLCGAHFLLPIFAVHKIYCCVFLWRFLAIRPSKSTQCLQITSIKHFKLLLCSKWLLKSLKLVNCSLFWLRTKQYMLPRKTPPMPAHDLLLEFATGSQTLFFPSLILHKKHIELIKSN